jgi:hypothetical protein
MTWKNSVQVLASSLLLTVAVASGPARAANPVKDVRLYAIECGRIDVKDLGAFADTGEYDGHSGTLTVSCYLIRHPKGTLLWDTGLSDKLAENKAGVDIGGFKLTVVRPLIDQLKSIEVTPADVTHLAVSHFHFDHTGNANAFGASTWIINKAELAWAESTPTPFGVDPSTFSASKTAKTQLIDGDFDVFGDGSVRILRAPGHTPGLGRPLPHAREPHAQAGTWVQLRTGGHAGLDGSGREDREEHQGPLHRPARWQGRRVAAEVPGVPGVSCACAPAVVKRSRAQDAEAYADASTDVQSGRPQPVPRDLWPPL